jgi:NADH:ubiquinone oxidoreductase subunit F (NADH-binding)
MSLATTSHALPRLLAGLGDEEPHALATHLQRHGPLPPPVRSVRQRAVLLEELELAGLCGRGGGSFPLARKLRAVLAGAQPRSVRQVVGNGLEGDPTSMKDRTLMSMLPHLVLDGLVIAADLVGAQRALLALAGSARDARAALELALHERRRPLREWPQVELVALPDRYIAGQESALLSCLEGGAPLPRFASPPHRRGLSGAPTLLSNVETLAHLALVARHGAEWFRALGSSEDPGSALVTLWGAVRHPGVYEVEQAAALGALIEGAGGATAPLRAVLCGGLAGGWIDGSQLARTTIDKAALARRGVALGTGSLVMLPQETCGLAETARMLRFLAVEGAGQCGPCRHGLAAIASCFEAALQGDAGARAHKRLHELARLIDGRGACSHPDGSARLLRSALEVFAPELEWHMRNGICPGCEAEPILPLAPRTPERRSVRTAAAASAARRS